MKEGKEERGEKGRRERGKKGKTRGRGGGFTEYALPPEPGVASVNTDSMHPDPVHMVPSEVHGFG